MNQIYSKGYVVKQRNMLLRLIGGVKPLKKGDDATSHKQREKNGDIGPFLDLIHVSN